MRKQVTEQQATRKSARANCIWFLEEAETDLNVEGWGRDQERSVLVAMVKGEFRELKGTNRSDQTSKPSFVLESEEHLF